MAQEIEIEFKTLLSYNDFHTLLRALPFPSKPIAQTNHYFDTEDMKLKQHNSALRIREKNDHYTLTLKQAREKDVLETHDTLTKHECEAWMKGNPIAKPENQQVLKTLDVSISDLMYYGYLQTKRYTFQQGDIEFVLDESNYLGEHDYELEVEAKNYANGHDVFEKLLFQYSIQKQSPITKIARFFQTLHHRDH